MTMSWTSSHNVSDCNFKLYCNSGLISFLKHDMSVFLRHDIITLADARSRDKKVFDIFDEYG